MPKIDGVLRKVPLLLRYSDRASKIFLIGPFPPPTHGMAFINAMMRDRIISLGASCIILDTSPRTINRNLSARLIRITIVLFCLLRLFFYGLRTKTPVIYMSVAGGYGQLYDILFILLARLLRSQIYLHHHSYAYLNRKNRIFQLLTIITGKKAFHITLCNQMAKRLMDSYIRAERIIVLSNAVLISNDILDVQIPRHSLKRIGFLGNISDAKGIFEFLNVMRYLSKKQPKLNIQGLIAGPFENAKIERQVLSDLKDLANVSYVGPKYESEKLDFFRSIDALLFPTKYENEAEPLTIHEAMATGLPVIASQRGCIKEIISTESGFVINQQDNFVRSAAERILLWALSPTEYRRVSICAHNRFLYLRSLYQERIKFLFGEMLMENDRSKNMEFNKIPID